MENKEICQRCKKKYIATLDSRYCDSCYDELLSFSLSDQKGGKSKE